MIDYNDKNITRNDILEVFMKVKNVDEPNITFPQANSFERIIDLLDLLYHDRYHTKEELTEIFSFEGRQTDYYCNAAKYLDLVEEGKIVIGNTSKSIIVLSSKGLNIFSSKYKKRQLLLVETILEHKAFYETFKLYMYEKEPTIEMKLKCIQGNTFDDYSEETLKRRTSTITSWVKWINNLYKEIEI